MNETGCSLDQLQPGQAGTIVSIEGATVAAQRMLEMGLTEGEMIEVVALAPFGDPIEIRIRNYQLSIRRVDAAHVMVQRAESH